jgi:hypothetical protein
MKEILENYLDLDNLELSEECDVCYTYVEPPGECYRTIDGNSYIIMTSKEYSEYLNSEIYAEVCDEIHHRLAMWMRGTLLSSDLPITDFVDIDSDMLVDSILSNPHKYIGCEDVHFDITHNGESYVILEF